MSETATTVWAPSEDDRFELFEWTDPKDGEKMIVQLVNWNPTFCFVCAPGTNEGGPTRPDTLKPLSGPLRPLTFFVIYERPKDFPSGYVVRRHWVFNDGRRLASFYHEGKTAHLESARELVPISTVNVGRSMTDDPCICEVWM